MLSHAFSVLIFGLREFSPDIFFDKLQRLVVDFKTMGFMLRASVVTKPIVFAF